MKSSFVINRAETIEEEKAGQFFFFFILPLLSDSASHGRVFCCVCPAGCPGPEPIMQVLGQPASSNITVSSSPLSVHAGSQSTAGPPPSYHADARWDISVAPNPPEKLKMRA